MPTGYRVEGKASYVADGPIAEAVDKLLEPMKARGIKPLGGAIVVKANRIVNVAPGANLHREI